MSGLLYSVCFLLVITISAQGDPWKLPWSNCGTSNDTMHVSSITMELHPRIGIGYPYNITVITSLEKKSEIHGGNLMFTLKWIPKPHMEFVLANEVLNLCDLLVQLRHPCPLHPGNYVLLYSAAIPNAVPKGQYKAQVVAKDQNNDEVLCINANFTLNN